MRYKGEKMQAYSDPGREQEPTALPDIEIWYDDTDNKDPMMHPKGWYYWFCFPGCLPDSEAIGPFDTYGDALEDAQEANQ